MGIPRFFVWLKKQNYPGVLQDSLPAVDWLIFDTNSLFHQAHQITYAYGDYFNKERAQLIRTISPERLEAEFRNTLITLLMTTINRVRPTEGVLIAVDGVAPQAKIQQQRQRRYKGSRTSDNEEEEVSPELAELRKPIVDPNRITPGTDFMFRLDDFLKAWLKNPKNTLQIGVRKIIYSSHLVPGEGEHKYLELLRSGDIPTTGVHVIHGMDADLFILSLAAPVERIYITREDINQVVSIQNFRHTLYRLMKTETTPTDFALMTFFIGNDFLPRQPSLHNMKKGINALISAYVQVGKPLTTKTAKGYFIIWENLEEFLKVMATNEGALLANEAIKGFKYPSPPFERALEITVTQKASTDVEAQAKSPLTQEAVKKSYTFHYNTFRDYWYQHALGPRGNTSILEFLMGREIYPISVNRIVEQSIAYLRGLAWNLVYYMDGWNRASLEYVYPYHQAPLFNDLVSVLAAQRVNDPPEAPPTYPILNEGIFQEPDYVYNFNPIHQLLAVLPFESQNLLPPEVRNLMNVDSPIYDIFPNQFLIDRVGTNRKWEGLPLIPYVESDRIIATVGDVPFSEKRWKRYLAGENYVVTLTEEQVDLVRKQRERLAKVEQIFPTRRGRFGPKTGRRTPREGTQSPTVHGRGERVRGGWSQQTKAQKQEEWRSARIFL